MSDLATFRLIATASPCLTEEESGEIAPGLAVLWHELLTGWGDLRADASRRGPIVRTFTRNELVFDVPGDLYSAVAPWLTERAEQLGLELT
jgi:hypothetical protein